VTSLTIAREGNVSKGFGFVTFETAEMAKRFIDQCEEEIIRDKDGYPIYAHLFETK
jgi:hypothetical protein